MARDFAKRGKKPGARKPATRHQGNNGGGRGWRPFLAGLLTGVFGSFLVYLANLPGADAPPGREPASPQPAAQPPRPEFEFYTKLQEETLEIEMEAPAVEPASDLGAPPPAAGGGDVYLLQAGAFRQRDDADRRRAQLLMLGLEPTVQESDGELGRWYRVYLGPYASPLEMKHARSLTAAEDIDTMLLKRRAR